MMQLDLGSLLNTEPKTEYIRQCFRVSEWELNTPENEPKVFVTTKEFLDYYDMSQEWLELFEEAIPEEVYEDAKRILFDVDFTQLSWSIHLDKRPSTIAMICIYLSYCFHGMQDNFRKEFNNLLKFKGEGREVFGMKRKNYSRVGTHKTFSQVTKYAQDVLNTMPGKFDSLEKMHKKLEGIA